MKMQLEKSYFDLAAMSKSDCLIICDGGTMDIKARKCCCKSSIFTTSVTGLRCVVCFGFMSLFRR